MDRQHINKTFGVTEAQLDTWAEEYESDTWNGKLGKVIMGRPSIADEEVRPVTVRLPISRIMALDKAATMRNVTRSTVLREAIDGYLL